MSQRPQNQPQQQHQQQPTPASSQHNSDVSSRSNDEPIRQKRTSVACRRCRRLRIKCIQDHGKLPCAQCRSAGSSESHTCAIPKRGDDRDRRYRIKYPQERDLVRPNESATSMAATAATTAMTIVEDATWSSPRSGSPRNVGIDHLSPLTARKIEIYSTSDIWSLLPPHEELIRGARVFVTTCLQVGMAKAVFIPSKHAISTHASIHSFKRFVSTKPVGIFRHLPYGLPFSSFPAHRFA
jgi:hypothetical protein